MNKSYMYNKGGLARTMQSYVRNVIAKRLHLVGTYRILYIRTQTCMSMPHTHRHAIEPQGSSCTW